MNPDSLCTSVAVAVAVAVHSKYPNKTKHISKPTTTTNVMGICGLFCFVFLHFLFHYHHHHHLHLGLCRLDFPIGSRVMVPVPPAYQSGFHGRAIVLDAGTAHPTFKAALSIEAADDEDETYSCSLSVFLGDLKVWASDHFVSFLPSRACTLELTGDGNLQLHGGGRRIGWQSWTSGQGVKALWLQKTTGNLVLADAKNHTKWQSFDFPGDIMLWGQRLNASTRLTSFATNSSASYSFEFQPDKLSVYLNWRDHRYSYWELRPRDRSFAFARLGSRGLKLFDGNSRKIGEIQAMGVEPVRFLLLEGTGNLGFYYYSALHGKFEASYRVLDRFCDLPLPCGPYGICTASNICTCVTLSRTDCAAAPDCNSEVEMVELDGVDTVLRTASPRINVSKEECVNSCKKDCSCTAALYSDAGIQGDCFQYGLVAGAREAQRGAGFSYWVKVPKETTHTTEHQETSSSLMNKLLIVGVVVNGLAVSVIIVGLLYYFSQICKRTHNSEPITIEPENIN